MDVKHHTAEVTLMPHQSCGPPVCRLLVTLVAIHWALEPILSSPLLALQAPVQPRGGRMGDDAHSMKFAPS